MPAIDVSPAEVARVRAPIATATTLPPAFYTHQAVYDEIADRGLRHSWLPTYSAVGAVFPLLCFFIGGARHRRPHDQRRSSSPSGPTWPH